MKPTTYKECQENNQANNRQPNHSKAKSLKETAKQRQQFLNQQITAQNANFIFEGLYSSLIEILHAHLIQKGIIITNHVCIGYYLRDKLNKQRLYRMFDECRYKRNSLVYYGNRMPEKTARESITTIKQLIQHAYEMQ